MMACEAAHGAHRKGWVSFRVAVGKNTVVVRGVPEFHRQAADEALLRVEQARRELAASQVVIDQLDVLLAEADSATP